jgi:hypothetical protein
MPQQVVTTPNHVAKAAQYIPRAATWLLLLSIEAQELEFADRRRDENLFAHQRWFRWSDP